MLRIGVDVGSTTMKIVALEDEKLIYSAYKRHFSQIIETGKEMLSALIDEIGDRKASIAFTGSAGMGVAETSSIPFIQEVYSTRIAAKKYKSDTDAIIELGGEDAKILFLTGGLEVRMNGSCAGGTGAFIDQMATLLGVSMDSINSLAEKATQLYTIASRCGVFAKSDIQPLINQGAKKEDIAASILVSVVNQTIAGLAQGRKIKGNVLYLGGPLTFIPKLRDYFDEALKTKGECPENSLYFVALGAALSDGREMKISEAIETLENYRGKGTYHKLNPLFKNRDEYNAFVERHKKATVKMGDVATYKGKAYLGLDSGSTTVKASLISEDGSLLLSEYKSNNGNPLETIFSFIKSIYEKYPDITIGGAASTGYGEDLMKTALNLDWSLVETMAHFTGAKYFLPDVDFIIDIGGQDIKCFKIQDGTVDDIFLNEACSSGCGSFLQTFANALGKTSEEFSSLAIDSQNPVDLGSRCTVFMNSSVKQAQKDGASVNDISAGLAISVVKNALYKVIRASSAEELGKNIVVQGGTFLNDAVLRSFELELKKNVIRPEIAGLMGSYGAALYAKKKAEKEHKEKSSILTLEELNSLKHEIKSVRCQGCTNHCLLTINNFGERRLISGAKCEKPLKKKEGKAQEDNNIYAFKQEELKKYMDVEKSEGKRTIALPLALGMYELLPFYSTLFRELGYNVITSPFSDRNLYIKGQDSIPSDTICFPAKLMHGHINYLVENGAEEIFIPCSSYNVNEYKGSNHFNCPVVAYYGEVIKGNMELENTKLTLAYLSLDNKHHFIKRISEVFDLDKKDVKKAVNKAYKELKSYHDRIEKKASEIIENSRKEGKRIFVLSGRPYHVDPEINHSIDRLITSLGVSVITEDSISELTKKQSVNVLNQWTYHARLYDAASYITDYSDMDLVQLVSFGCGLDAVTTDEVRSILRRKNKIYTQLKIDEITNVGAVKIRLRSLLAALEDK